MVGPAPFPEPSKARTLPRPRPLALARLAVESVVDGALHEGVSASVVAKLARRCEDPAIAAVLKEIAADEGRHAAHGWDVVEWCLSEGGSATAAALLGALVMLPERPALPRRGGGADGSWERWGIPGSELEADDYAAMRAVVERRVRTMVARVPAQASAIAPQRHRRENGPVDAGS